MTIFILIFLGIILKLIYKDSELRCGHGKHRSKRSLDGYAL